MISKIRGILTEKKENSVILQTGSLYYEIMVPSIIIKAIDKAANEAGEITLIIYQYIQIDTSKGIPQLVGFLNEIEKDFFEHFLTVSGIGPKAAIKALNEPFSLIAEAIDDGNVEFLKKLPGVGPQRAKEIVAKLQGKVGKYALIQDSESKSPSQQKQNIEEDALDILLQLQYKRSEASQMIKTALDRNHNIKTSEDLLNEVYKQRKN